MGVAGYRVSGTAQREKTGVCRGLYTLGSAHSLRETLDLEGCEIGGWCLTCPDPKEQAGSHGYWLNAQWKVFLES